MMATEKTPAEMAREAALAAYDAELCIVPPRQDGSKSPITENVTIDGESRESWKHWQKVRPDRSKVESWVLSELSVGAE